MLLRCVTCTRVTLLAVMFLRWPPLFAGGTCLDRGLFQCQSCSFGWFLVCMAVTQHLNHHLAFFFILFKPRRRWNSARAAAGPPEGDWEDEEIQGCHSAECLDARQLRLRQQECVCSFWSDLVWLVLVSKKKTPTTSGGGSGDVPWIREFCFWNCFYTTNPKLLTFRLAQREV